MLTLNTTFPFKLLASIEVTSFVPAISIRLASFSADIVISYVLTSLLSAFTDFTLLPELITSNIAFDTSAFTSVLSDTLFFHVPSSCLAYEIFFPFSLLVSVYISVLISIPSAFAVIVILALPFFSSIVPLREKLTSSDIPCALIPASILMSIL